MGITSVLIALAETGKRVTYVFDVSHGCGWFLWALFEREIEKREQVVVVSVAEAFVETVLVLRFKFERWAAALG